MLTLLKYYDEIQKLEPHKQVAFIQNLMKSYYFMPSTAEHVYDNIRLYEEDLLLKT